MGQISVFKLVAGAFFILGSTVSLSQETMEEADPGFRPLIQVMTTTVNKGGFSVTRYEEKFVITTQSGAVKRANYDIVSEDNRAAFSLVKATVTNGPNETDIDDEKVHRTKQSIPYQNGLTEISVYRVPFRQIRVGSTIHIIYELKTAPVIPGIFNYANGIGNDIFAEDERQIVISDLPLNVKHEGFGEDFSIKESNENGKYKVEVSPTEKGRALVGKGDKIAAFFVSNARSWKQINQRVAPPYLAVVNEKLPVAFDAIVKKAARLDTPEQKIEFVSDEISQLITYSGDWRTIEGKYFPVGLDALVRAGRGDCKDFSASLAAILNKLGFKAHVALSYRSQPGMNRNFHREMSEMPSLTLFNHAIVQAKDGSGKTWWLDPTNPKVLANVIGADLLGNFALVLDGVSDRVEFIPEKNQSPWLLQMSQTLELAPDGAVEVVSRQEYNETAFGTMILVEKFVGSENMTKAFVGMVQPQLKVSGQSTFKKENDKFIYDVRFRTPELLEDRKGTSLSFRLLPMVGSILFEERRSPRGDLDIGEVGEVKSDFLIKNHKVVDPIDAECLVRSPWADFERAVKIEGENTKVSDRLTIKKRYVSENEKKKVDYEQFYSDMRSCTAVSEILVSFNKNKLSEDDLKWQKLKGPGIQEMSELDVVALRNIEDVRARSYVDKKIYRFYSNRILKNELDIPAYAERAFALRNMGYQHGNTFAESYLFAALDEVALAEKHLGVGFDAKLSRTKAQALGNLGRMHDAIQVLGVLQKKAPDSYETAITGFYLADLTKNYPVAEKWLKVALPRSIYPFQKNYVRGRLASVLGEQKKYSEAMVHFDALLKDAPGNAWTWHNASFVLSDMENFDKAIEYERKALEIMQFGAAKGMLAKLLVKKADAVRKKLGQGRDSIDIPYDKDQIALYQEALKWDSENLQAHVHLAEVHVQDFKAGKDKQGLKKAREFVTKALFIKPKYPYGNEMLKRLDEMEGSRVPAKAD